MNNPQAVIEIGSTGIRLLVAEITNDKKRNILDSSEAPVDIGHDVFTTGSISKETMLRSQRILSRYGEQLASWGISKKNVSVLATSAVREAANRDPFVDRIKIHTGFTVHVTDGIEENRLMYTALSDCMKEESINVRQSNTIIIEISGGATEIMLMEKGSMVAVHSLRLGTVIIDGMLKSMAGNIKDASRYIEEFIHNTRNTFNTEIDLSKIEQFIALSPDMKLAALNAGKPISTFLWEIKREDFENFAQKVIFYTQEECVDKFKLTYSEVRTFQIALLIYVKFLALTKVNSIIVPETSIREGKIISLFSEEKESENEVFSSQIIASAETLLKRYHGDEKHAQYVRLVSCRIFDTMKKELGLDAHARLLLEVSAILHDVGMFIRAEDHNVHSNYIIKNSEIFGLTRDDITIIAFIALFHRGNALPHNGQEVKLLPREARLTILKLCSILRVADAFDRSHRQRFKNFDISVSKETVNIRIKEHTSLAMERLAIKEKGVMFENVFGYNIYLS